MECYDTLHYSFHFRSGSVAQRDIQKIAQGQEACYQYICRVLGIAPDLRIEYFLCDTPEEVGEIYGDDEPCNGFACAPDKIYAVYNDLIKCIGFHEDAHLISYTINRPDCPAVREGLAMYFDRRWWGIHNMDWAMYYQEQGMLLSVDSLLDREVFFSQDCSITYPIMGAFTDFLISSWGIERYKRVYGMVDSRAALYEIYGSAVFREFESWLLLFRLDDGVKQRIVELLN